MKVCYIITKADEIGGAQIHIRDLSKRLLQDGHEPVVITGEEGLLTDFLKDIGVKVYVVEVLKREISIKNDLKALVKIIKCLKKIKPNLVSLHSSKAGIIGRVACSVLKLKVIFTAHGWAFANGVENKGKYIRIERFFSKFADRIITVSAQDKELALKYNVACDEQQVVIHNGMYDIQYPKKTKNISDTINLIMVARFSEQKDHKTLFESLYRIKSLNWHLHLVGKGPELEKFIKLSEELGLSKKITFHGERNDVDKLLFEMDVFLLIANWEGFPRSILEAMRSSLPVIASDVGGTSEAIKDGINGYLIPKGCSKTLEIRLSELIHSQSKRAKFGNQNRDDFINHFTFDSMYKKTFNVYSEIAK